MVSGKYFNRLVMALDNPYIGYVAREADDLIVVFGEKNKRYDIPKDKVQTVSRNVLIGMKFDEIVSNYSVSRDADLPPSAKTPEPWAGSGDIDLATYEKEFDKSLFNKGVRTQNEDHVGHVMKETDDKIVVFGHYNYRYDIPKSKIIAVGRNVIIGMDFPEVFDYLVDRDVPLPE